MRANLLLPGYGKLVRFAGKISRPRKAHSLFFRNRRTQEIRCVTCPTHAQSRSFCTFFYQQCLGIIGRDRKKRGMRPTANREMPLCLLPVVRTSGQRLFSEERQPEGDRRAQNLPKDTISTEISAKERDWLPLIMNSCSCGRVPVPILP